jgi:glycosyltransferase involved in cell wall biosynthesis
METPSEEYFSIAIMAENASLQLGGEAALPVHYFSRLRERGIAAWLIVHARTRPELDALFPDDRDRILTIPDLWIHKLIWSLGKVLPGNVSAVVTNTAIQLLNQSIQRGMVLRLIEEHGIHLVHQPTPVSPKAPSSFSSMGVAVLIGPMNGGMEYPGGFRHKESRFAQVAVGFGRRIANLLNFVIAGKRHADMLLVANERTQRALPSCACRAVLQIPENGVDLRIWASREWKPGDCREQAPNFVFIGRLVDWKRLDIVLHALARVPEARLLVVGDGALRSEWTQLAGRLGMAGRTRFAGWLSQKECSTVLQNATALVLPSILECGGAVVLEAMATGTPVIATEWGGPADYIDASCGILVTPASEEALIQGFADGMKRLADDPDLCARLGRAGRVRVEQEYDWNHKIDQILEIYDRTLKLHAARKG